MAAARRRGPAGPLVLRIEDLSHDGRGVGRREDGKPVFVAGALPGETVRALPERRHRTYDEAVAAEVLEAAPERIEPRCPHFGTCGGCTLQHLAPEAQVRAKQSWLLENLARIARSVPEQVLAPVTGPVWGYRRRARLAVRDVPKKGRVLVGFRERGGRYVADMRVCEVLDPRFARLIEPLSELVAGLSVRRRLPQVELAAGDEAAALVFRHLDPLTGADRDRLRAFGEAHGLQVHLQPGGPETVAALWPEDPPPLAYALTEFDVTLRFGPLDFTQVNAAVNRAMVAQAVALLDPRPGERVLDLFCGIGNFSLPLARRGARVEGVEGEAGLAARAAENARLNGLEGQARFHVADLATPPVNAPWLEGGVDKALLDPPRSGAEAMAHRLGELGVARIVYVSCHPATLARDVGVLAGRYGYRLRAAGIMDMFPHTAHVESIALLERA